MHCNRGRLTNGNTGITPTKTVAFVMVGVMASTVINIESYTHVPRLLDRIETLHGISVHTNNSLVGCAALCLAKGNCWSLFYNFVTQICRLNKSPFLTVSETTSQSGFHHYSREFCTSDIPAINHISQTVSFINGTPTIMVDCTSNAVQISGNGVVTCDLGTLMWSTPDIVCKDLTFYNALGYTHLCGKESILKFVGTMTLYDQADTLCRNEGAHLARPRTSTRWTCLADYAEASTTGVHVWMDITDRSVEGTFVFSDNTLVPLPHYWLPNEPYAPTASTDDCVGIWPSWRQWDDMPCGNNAYYICEIEF